jgi:hypothetical protein
LPRLVQPYLRQCLQGRLESIETYLINSPLIFLVIVNLRFILVGNLKSFIQLKKNLIY